MPRTPPEDLQTFLQRQDASTLAAVLLELAGDHEAVKARLTRLQLADRPDKLAAGFRKSLNGWRRSRRFMVGGEARQFGRALEDWLDQVARELMPKAPPTALELFQAFIEADAVFFECADDSDGAVGDAVRSGCRYWLQAASRCETPPGEWPGRVVDFVKFAKDQAAVLMKTNAKGVYVSQIGLGGNPNEFITLVLFDSFADIAKFAEAYGKAATEAKLQPMVPGTVANNEWRVYRYVPELSIIP